MSAFPADSRAMPAITEVPLTSIWFDGRPVSEAALRTLGAVRVRQEVSAPTVCELELDLGADLIVPRRGMSLRVSVEGSDGDVFTGEIVAVGHHLGPDGIHRVRVRGFDATHRMRQTSAVKVYTDETVAGIVRTLAGKHGLTVDADGDGPRWPRIIQQGESDLSFAGRLLADASLWWQLDDGRLRLRRWAVTDIESATWGVDLYEAVLDSDPTSAITNVRTIGWDPVERKVIDANASSSSAGQQVGDLLGGDGDLVLADRLCASSGHAEAIAQSELDARSGAVETVRAVVRGDLRWRPGVGLRIEGQPAELSGPYLLTSVEHVVDQLSGYVCILASRPVPVPVRATGGLPASGLAAFVMAEVVNIDDPDRAGRIKVKFATLDDIESEWLPVLSFGAGPDKGLFCQPDRGDIVLVLHAADDPGRGVVLGGLWADHLPGDSAGVADNAVRRFAWNTPDGQRLLLNRDDDQVIVANAAGSRIEVSQSAMLIHSEVDLTIAAPGRRLVIKANTVDFERG